MHFVLFLSILFSAFSFHASSILFEKIQTSKAAAESELRSIYQRWEVSNYPNFFKTCWMEKPSWDILILKFQYAVLNINGLKDFVISFTGSSVTAGHDSRISEAFPALVHSMLSPAFRIAGLELIVRNVALGNNPCMPYDICVRTFAGEDADIVVWEQTYNCGNDKHKAVLEQFLRQAMIMPRRPIVVYSDSVTTNWYVC